MCNEICSDQVLNIQANHLEEQAVSPQNPPSHGQHVFITLPTGATKLQVPNNENEFQELSWQRVGGAPRPLDTPCSEEQDVEFHVLSGQRVGGAPRPLDKPCSEEQDACDFESVASILADIVQHFRRLTAQYWTIVRTSIIYTFSNWIFYFHPS